MAALGACSTLGTHGGEELGRWGEAEEAMAGPGAAGAVPLRAPL